MASLNANIVAFPTLRSLGIPRVTRALGWMIGIALPLIAALLLLVPLGPDRSRTGRGHRT